MSEWQPIETAPKDGTHILVYVPYEELIYVVLWESEYIQDGGWLEADGEHWKTYKPSHWMPLPEPPTAETQRGDVR